MYTHVSKCKNNKRKENKNYCACGRGRGGRIERAM
jgi:hypothetical protein